MEEGCDGYYTDIRNGKEVSKYRHSIQTLLKKQKLVTDI